MSRAKDTDGIVAGAQNDNPMLDTRVYNVMFPNGAKRQYSANVNAQSMYANVDEDGHQYQLMDEIIEHRKDGTWRLMIASPLALPRTVRALAHGR
jgi:hypothetical protein